MKKQQKDKKVKKDRRENLGIFERYLPNNADVSC